MIVLRPLLISLVCCSLVTTSAELTPQERAERRKKNKRRKNRGKCPADQPENEKPCLRHPSRKPCKYNFQNIPTSTPEGQCEGSLECTAMTECKCRQRTWDCITFEMAICNPGQGNDFPPGSFAACGKSTLAPTAAPTDTLLLAPTMFPTDNIFQKDDCPPTAPTTPGMACTRPSDLPLCGYEYTNRPIPEDDGTCLGALDCSPTITCRCEPTAGSTWICDARATRPCRDGDPPGANLPCTPPPPAE